MLKNLFSYNYMNFVVFIHGAAMEGTSCENFDINQNNVRRVDEIKRLLMLSDFHNCNTFITWEGNSNMIR